MSATLTATKSAASPACSRWPAKLPATPNPMKLLNSVICICGSIGAARAAASLSMFRAAGLPPKRELIRAQPPGGAQSPRRKLCTRADFPSPYGHKESSQRQAVIPVLGRAPRFC
ncbi:hypothetical protein D3C80_1879280 [compost metagenome]